MYSTSTLIALLLLIGASSQRLQDFEDGTMGRQPRSIPDFGVLIFCKTKTNPFKYNGYGCYCGFGGQGKPVDGLDRCCQVHDSCYEWLETKFNIKSLASYLTPYFINFFTCDCHNWQLTKFQMELCKCDQHAAQCFKRNDYNPRYRKYDRKKCLSLSELNDFEEEEELLDNIPTKDELKN